MIVKSVRTRIFRPGENLVEFINESVPSKLVGEGMVLAVTSKIVSLAENRIVSSDDKLALVRSEADVFMGEIGYGCSLTIKHGLLIPSAGIDESNSERGGFILYPEDPMKSAHGLWRTLRGLWRIENLGILLTDSHTSPLRRGVTGVCLAHFGFKPVRNLVGTTDLFGRELKMTQMNLADGLAAATVMLMGEGQESQPLAVVHEAPIDFSDDGRAADLAIPAREDLYFPILEPFF